MRLPLILTGLALSTGGIAIAQQAPSPALAAAVKAPTRTPANVARDRYRHPAETLAFFGVKPTDTVVEIWPSGGWYTEILAPYLGSARHALSPRSRATGGRSATSSSNRRIPPPIDNVNYRRLSRRRRRRRRRCPPAPPTSS